MTVRLTPVAAIISCSVGSREPGGSLPLVMSAVSRATSSAVRPRGALSGRNNWRFFEDRLGKGLTPAWVVRSSYDLTINTPRRRGAILTAPTAPAPQGSRMPRGDWDNATTWRRQINETHDSFCRGGRRRRSHDVRARHGQCPAKGGAQGLGCASRRLSDGRGRREHGQETREGDQRPPQRPDVPVDAARR